MDKKMCEHNTSMVIYAGADTTVEICDWGCDRILVHKILPSGTSQLVREVEHPQVAVLREEVERLRKFFNEMEWSGDPNINICPDCGNKKAQGHRPSCRYRVFRGE